MWILSSLLMIGFLNCKQSDSLSTGNGGRSGAGGATEVDTLKLQASLASAVGSLNLGMGVELDPHFFSQNLTRNDGAKSSDWEIVEKRVAMMEVSRFRIMILPQWYEPINDNNDPSSTDLTKFTFKSEEMQSLYKVLDLAENNGIDVCLVLWGCPVGVSLLDPAYSSVTTCFMADPSKKDTWITGPVDNEEWAENFVTLVKYLKENLHYSCIKEITPINEPDGGPILTEEQYIKMVGVLDQRFKKEGLRDQIKFNLSDNTDTRTFYLKACAAALTNEADLFNSHTYIFGYDTPNDSIYNWEKTNVDIASSAGKKHMVGEFGSNQTVGATRQRDIDLYERGVLMSRLILNFLNAGAAGVSYWSLIDQYYGKDADYSQMQQLGLWRYVKAAYKTDTTYSRIKEDYEVRPQYFAYSLLTRFIRKEDEVFPLEFNNTQGFIVGTALKAKNGKYTYVIANQTDKAVEVSVTTPTGTNNTSTASNAGSSVYAVYRYQKDSLPTGDRMVSAATNVELGPDNDGSGNDELKITAAPNSVILYKEK